MAASNSGDVWSGLGGICNELPYKTVAELKNIIVGINEECDVHLTRTGKKQLLVDRLRIQFVTWQSANLVEKWRGAKRVIEQIGSTNAAYVKSPLISSPMPQTSFPDDSPIYAGGAHYSGAMSNPISSHPPNFSPGYRFKQSPFFEIDRVVSPVLECPESFSSTDRREVSLSFRLDNDVLAKLQAHGSPYQLRLFCTSSKFFSPGYNGNTECLVEFPQTCEIYFNEVQLKSSLLKGIKKRPGTAPPPNIGAVVRNWWPDNTVKMIYINGGQGPVELKKYYLIVQLAKAQSVDTLVDDLVNKRFVGSQEIRRQMVSSTLEDDDIIAGSLKMSLKCPLSFMRITTPCRSSRCTHSQCFDATSWFAVMEQTTTWLCPICENVLDWRELIIDGFFCEILKMTSDAVDDVIVEADGQWYTSDKKYFSTYGAKTNGSLACRGPQYIDLV
ncbi:PINIT domain-containing protein [Mycena rebaudengoi]|nr:PINIT domain-containing protein [Mycena rebaudengoi]